MALADVCGLKTNQLKNSFLSDFGGSSTHLLDDALTSTTNFTVPYGIDPVESLKEFTNPKSDVKIHFDHGTTTLASNFNMVSLLLLIQEPLQDLLLSPRPLKR